VPGLQVDTDLRWHLLHRLVLLGRAGDAEIEAELARDATSAGERQAATSRALRPSDSAKDEAWRLAVEDDSVPNAVQAAIISGFWSAEQLPLLERFVEPYFASLATVWETRTAEMAQNVVVGLYPSLLVSSEVVERTDAYLAGGDVPPRCADCCSRAGTASCAPCGRGSGTAPSRTSHGGTWLRPRLGDGATSGSGRGEPPAVTYQPLPIFTRCVLE
jgi:hypothetical protein